MSYASQHRLYNEGTALEVLTMGNSVKVVQEGNDFQVHVQLSDELLGNTDDLETLLNQSLSRHNIHVCMFRYNNVVKFTSSDFEGESAQKALTIVCEKVNECLPTFVQSTMLIKRKRQVRDALNKCTDPEIIEEIGRLLKV